MAKVYAFEGIIPVIAPSSFVHPDAVLIGDVIVGENCYIGPCACLRGDFGRIIVGDGANVQDTCVLHSFPGKDMLIERNGHVGHGAILHGCVVGENVLVGMNSVVMDGVIIGTNSFIAAHSFVKAGMQIPENVLVSGSPARITRTLTEQEIQWKSNGTRGYQNLAQRCLAGLVATEPLREVEPNRPRSDWSQQNATALHVVKQKQDV